MCKIVVIASHLSLSQMCAIHPRTLNLESISYQNVLCQHENNNTNDNLLLIIINNYYNFVIIDNN